MYIDIQESMAKEQFDAGYSESDLKIIAKNIGEL